MTSLSVRYAGEIVGQLRDDGDQFCFAYAPEWARFPISQSLPIREDEYTGGAAQTFFANLLPEGAVRHALCRRLGISESNDFELLRRIGGDCAGALSLMEPGGVQREPSRRSYERLDDRRLAQLVADDAVPLLIGGERTRLSLAGAQDKLPVAVMDGELRLPLDSAPSTHILKLPNRRYAHLPENEAFVLGFAEALGMDVAPHELVMRTDPPSLLVKRYDRVVTDDWPITRIHQEDLCQALGLPPSRKYEEEGGPTFARAVALVRDAVDEPLPAVRRLIEWQAFNVIAGNSDGHAKNISLLYGDATTLSPFYDLVCTRQYRRLDRKLAMSLHGRRDPHEIGRAQWAGLARDLAVAERVVLELVSELCTRAIERLGPWTSAFRERNGRRPILDTLPRRIRLQAQRVSRALGV